MRDRMALVSIFVGLVIFMALLLLAACGKSNADRAAELRESEPWKFKSGQIVESVLTGQRGQVVSGRRCKYCPTGSDVYDVRFAGIESRTNTKIFGRDNPVEHAPFAVIEMGEFELRAASQ